MTQAQMPNLLVLSAGGNGHVPIPLLKKPEKRLMGLPLRSRRYFTWHGADWGKGWSVTIKR